MIWLLVLLLLLLAVGGGVVVSKLLFLLLVVALALALFGVFNRSAAYPLRRTRAAGGRWGTARLWQSRSAAG